MVRPAFSLMMFRIYTLNPMAEKRGQSRSRAVSNRLHLPHRYASHITPFLLTRAKA